jgi:AhpD family alkylhydroperoxidase
LIVLETYLSDCDVERALIDLVKLRASQINGCAFCIDMHWKDARARGEHEQRRGRRSSQSPCRALFEGKAWSRLSVMGIALVLGGQWLLLRAQTMIAEQEDSATQSVVHSAL